MVKVREKSELITVDAGRNLAKLRDRRFLKPKIYSILLPYFDELQPEVDKNLQTILNGLIACFLTENPIEAEDYSEMLSKHIHQFGIRLEKPKFLNLIRFFYEATVKEDQDYRLMGTACKCFENVMGQIKLGALGWKDMTLDWKPLYSLYLRAINRKLNPNPAKQLDKVLWMFAWFYDPKEHKEIWERALEELSICAEIRFTTLCWNFLSIFGMSVEEVKQHCSSTWLRELWKMYLDAEMNTTWTVLCVDFFAEIVTMTPEAFDLSPHYDVLFTKTMRSFNLTVRGGKLSVGDGQESSTSAKLAQLCAYTIGGPKSSISHFKRLMHYIQFNVHPMNTGEHTEKISEFLYCFLSNFQKRIKHERLSEEKRKCPKEYYLTDGDIDEVTEAITDVCLMLMFTEDRMDDYKVIYVLTAMNREYVAPKMLDYLYSSLTAINEPGRLTIAIESFYMVIYEIIRSPDPKYRAPRAIVYDSTWLRKLEEQRKDWPTYTMGSELPEIHKHRLTTLRAHAFYIMEIFANNIDVNDVNRSAFILKTLIILFSSFPLMDFSEATKHHQGTMSEDDVIICKLSKRLPHFVEFVIEKILQIVDCLSICPPKSSGGAAAGLAMSSEDVKQEGEEETALKAGISQLVGVIFERVDERMRARLFETLFAYVSTSEFSGYMATELLSAIIASATWQSPSAFRKFAQYTVNKLSQILTEDVQKSKSVSSSVLFHVMMARAVYSAPHSLIVENEMMLVQISEMLLKCQCRKIFKAGRTGVGMILFALLTTNTEPLASLDNEKYQRPLDQWNPIDEWAKCIHYKNLKIKWYIPARPELECAQRLLNRLFFPFIQKLAEGNLDRDLLKLYTAYVESVFADAPFFRHPKYEKIVDIYTPYQLPLPSTSLGKSCSLEWELTGPNGENAREMILQMVEKVIPTTQDPTALSSLAGIAFHCLGRANTRFMDSDLEQSLTDVHRILMDSTYCKIMKASQHTMDELAYFRHAHVEAYHFYETRPANSFDARILKVLTALGMNDYEKVRKVAVTYLSLNQSQFYRCRDEILPQIVQVITDQTTNNADWMKGALGLITALGMVDSVNPKIRMIVWDALLRMRMMDDVVVCAFFETVVQAIKEIDKMPIYKKGKWETVKERNAKLAEIGALLVSNTDSFLTPDSLNSQLTAWHSFDQSRHTLRGELVEHLFTSYIRNKSLHHTREKLARSMIYNIQREAADEKTIKLLLSQLSDEEYEQRSEARTWLLYWMWKNKPAAVREEVSIPNRNVKTVECGVREDNMWLMYDSRNLPDSEEKWNAMHFVEKDRGACRWPRTLPVTRKRCNGPPLSPKTITPSDQLIINYFSSSFRMSTFFEQRRIEKEEHEAANENVFELFKYVLRNYPNESRPLKLFTDELILFLEGKPKKEKQLLAAELFLGIVLGLKHRTFQENQYFWSQITPRLDRFFDEMLGEAEDVWADVIRQSILSSHSDPRRHWWLVESLLAGVRRATHATDVQQAFRLRCVMVKRWRCGEIINRLVSVAYSKLPFSITDPLRFAIASVLRAAVQVREMNSSTSNFANIEARFYPETLDETIQKLTDHIPRLTTKKRAPMIGLTRCSKSDPELISPRKATPLKRARKRSLSPGSAEEKVSNIYMRTLLECILQYYEVSTHSWTPALVKLLPKLMEFANEDSWDLSEETYRNVDITQNSALLTHDYMSVTWLNEQFVDGVVEAWRTAFAMSSSWRVRLEVVKYIQASVYSNMFSMCKEARREAVQRLLFQALFDESITVRKETAKCLLLFIHCAYITIPPAKIEELGAILSSPQLAEPQIHGAALGLGAVALAHPFSVPREILKPLEHLNSCHCRRAFVKNEITSMLREFRRQHRDDWRKVRMVIGERLTFDIENATAPAYYA